MQQLIVAVIVLVAAVVLVRRIYTAFRSEGTQACGCAGCSQCAAKSTCTLDQDVEQGACPGTTAAQEEGPPEERGP